MFLVGENGALVSLVGGVLTVYHPGGPEAWLVVRPYGAEDDEAQMEVVYSAEPLWVRQVLHEITQRIAGGAHVVAIDEVIEAMEAAEREAVRA